ncbi:hypothetical protein [Pelagibacterium mangrovi]|uniref:hypothetical protein n=1 Tax=Pelagibacterium mangrovi TaxID=3119828 RepID=UPI002FCA776D
MILALPVTGSRIKSGMTVVVEGLGGPVSLLVILGLDPRIQQRGKPRGAEKVNFARLDIVGRTQQNALCEKNFAKRKNGGWRQIAVIAERFVI